MKFVQLGPELSHGNSSISTIQRLDASSALIHSMLSDVALVAGHPRVYDVFALAGDSWVGWRHPGMVPARRETVLAEDAAI